MSREDRRKLMDPQFVEKLRARLVRIRMARITRQTETLTTRVENLPPNWIENQLLAAARRKEQE